MENFFHPCCGPPSSGRGRGTANPYAEAWPRTLFCGLWLSPGGEGSASNDPKRSISVENTHTKGMSWGSSFVNSGWGQPPLPTLNVTRSHDALTVPTVRRFFFLKVGPVTRSDPLPPCEGWGGAHVPPPPPKPENPSVFDFQPMGGSECRSHLHSCVRRSPPAAPQHPGWAPGRWSVPTPRLCGGGPWTATPPSPDRPIASLVVWTNLLTKISPQIST